MIHDPALCDTARLTAFIDGDLSPDECRELEAHLDQCEKCRAALDEQIATPQAWEEVRSSLSERDVAHPGGESAGNTSDTVEFIRKLLGPTDDPQMLGRLGTYEIVGLLGQGGMGVVFKGFDASLNRYVAIKLLAPMFMASSAAKQRFLREARSAAAVVHDHVVAIHAISEWQGSPYLVMAYLRGESLQKRLATRGVLTSREILRIGMQVASGLAAAHAQGLIHRDIKPSNILLETEVDRVRITDFGLARAVDDIRLTRSDVLLGTPQYMSPEQARDDALDFRTDLFSLGSVLYEACTGRSPFQAATSYGVLRKITDHEPTPIRHINPDIPDWLEQMVSKLMAKNLQARFASAAEVALLFQQGLAHVEQPHLTALPDSLSRIPPNKLSLFWRIAMSTALVAAVCAGSFFMFAQPGAVNKSTAEKDPAKQTVAAKPPAAEPVKADALSAIAGDYKVTLRKTADVSQMQMKMEFDPSRMAVQQSSQTGGNSTGGGFAGAAAGGGGGTFLKPNRGFAFDVAPKSNKDGSIIEVSPQVKAVDDKGKEWTSPANGPGIIRFAEFERTVPGAHVAYLHVSDKEIAKFARLEGQVLVTPGRQLVAEFTNSPPQIQRVDKETFTFTGNMLTGRGLQIMVACPPTTIMSRARTPQERFEALVSSRGAYSAELEDDAGDIYPSEAGSSGGGGGSSSFSFGSSPPFGSKAGFPQHNGNPIQSFQFAPLPKGRTVKTIRVRFTDRTGPSQATPFTLENVPLAKGE